MRKALVTGGAGFIGTNLAAELLRRGYGVAILDDLSSGSAENLALVEKAEFIRADIRDLATVQKAVEGVDVVFHLAAAVGNARSIENPIYDASVNVIGTVNVLEAARQHRVPKVVFSSSAGVFGELKTLPIREDHPVEPDSPYGATKLCAEKLCLAYSRLHEMDAICLRYFNVYGPLQRSDQYANAIPVLVFRALRGEDVVVFGDGEQTRDFVNVRDVVQANVKAAETPALSGAFNIASGTSVTINELLSTIRESGEIDFKTVFGPRRAGDVLHSVADISAARAAFGFQPEIGLADGLREYVGWARTQVAF